MYQPFAFYHAEDVPVDEQPGGHYDAEQQLWIADDISRAYTDADPKTMQPTRGRATMNPTAGDVPVDVYID